ncbi:MAG TPA: cation:proton antiporter [Candidatus Aenigmarchaeota archaeon]|nr:cation:proton antiporter [Candidatus Aenigmarchaeota archaeon]
MVIDALLWVPVTFGLMGAIGLLRMSKVYTRIFASTLCSVGCTCLLVLLLAVKHFYSTLSMKYLFLLFLLLLTTPTASHAIANAAYKNKIDLEEEKND